MPCNNPGCLYLHNIGADEDSFGKDEVAAVHTRSRVHQIVGAANNVIKRFGTVLPPPLDDSHISCSTFSDKSTTRNSVSDAAYGSGNSTTDSLPCKDKEGPIALPHKSTTFVDIVGRSSSAAGEKDGNYPEDKRIPGLCSELSSISVGGETHAEAPYSVPALFKNGFKISADESHREGSFFVPSYSSHISENGFAADHNHENNQEDEASLPIRCVNSTSNDSCQEIKFQNSAKSDRIYRSSRSFSNEEIVEHLRRIDNDDNLHNDEENSVLDAVKSNIISNIMSIDFDSCEDSLPVPNGLSELLEEADGLGGSSWSSLNSDQSGHSFAKHDCFASQMAASILPDYSDNNEQYSCKPHYPVSRAQSLIPPGFSMPSRDPPPGFSNSDRTSSLPRPSSGGRVPNASSFSSTLFQPAFDDVDFFTPAMLPTASPEPNTFDEARFWLMMQQSTPTHADPKFAQLYTPQIPSSQQELSFAGLHKVNGLSSRLVDERQNCDPLVDERQNCDPSFFTQMPQHKYANGGHEVQRKGEFELQRNERLGVNYLNGFGNLMFSSGDVYSRVFGL